MRQPPIVLATIAALLFGLLSPDARADWPSARHDQQRTGAADGTSNLTNPATYWRAYLGGVVSASQAMPLSIDGEPSLVYVASGRVHATTTEGTPLWSTGGESIVSLNGAADLDGDGWLEIVAQSLSQVFVIDSMSGDLKWSESEGEMGTIGGVLVTDVDGDNLPEIVIQECGCCQLNSGETGFVYGFDDGFSNPELRWRFPYVFCGGARSLAVADFDGDGDPDVVLGDNLHLEIYDGASGVSVASSASTDLGTWVAYSQCVAQELVGGAGQELVCVHGTELDAPGAGHRVFALRVDGSQLALMWSVDVGDRDEALKIPAGFIRDLDADGSLELTATGRDDDGRDLTLIIDALTGDVLTTLVDQIAVGIAPDGDGGILVTRSDNHLREWFFDRSAAAPLSLGWLLKFRRVVLTRDWSLAGRQQLAAQLLLADVDADGVEELFTTDTEDPSVLRVQSLHGGGTVTSWYAAAGADIVTGWVTDPTQLSISSADGQLTQLTTALDATVGSIRAGGYYAPGSWFQLALAPTVGDLDGDGRDELVITDSRRSLVAFDLADATNAGPPTHRWERARSFAPTIVPGLGASGATGVACRRLDNEALPPTELAVVLDAAGALRWETPISPLVYEDLVTGDFDGDDIPDLALQWGALDDTAIRTTALAGVDGRPLWTATTQAGPARFPSGAAVADWDDDGFDDVYFHHYATRVLSGFDGAQLVSSPPSQAAYFMPTLIDITGDVRPEIVLHAGFEPNRALTADLADSVWSSADDDRPYPYASVAVCPDGPVLVGAALAHPSRLKITVLSGTSAGAWQSVVLADGARYADEAAANENGARGGQLSSVHVHADLTGEAHPSAVVGSTDGWLYAIDPCINTLDFAMNFGVPVGALAFGDGDADGLDELFVSTADGYVHGIKHAPLGAPDGVRDIDPATGSLDDVDEVVTRGSLSASWDAIAGAQGYEVSVALAEGGIIAVPAWQRVDATYVTFADLPLEDGRRYVVAVRALSVNGPSPDTLSDGVLVRLDEVPPGADANGPSMEHPGGCCDVGHHDPRGAFLLAAVVGFLGRRRTTLNARARRERRR